MGFLSGKSKTPDIKATAPAPKVGDQEAAAKVEDRKKGRKGIGGNILSLNGNSSNNVGSSLLGKSAQ